MVLCGDTRAMDRAPGDGRSERWPTVSAIVPAYNSSATIRETLRSIYDQTYPHIIEVIVVDDGSTDDTPSIIASEFPDVILIRQENAGGAAARNTGARRATGDYLALLDHDDQWLPHKIETQVQVMEEHPEIALVTCLPAPLGPSGDEERASQERTRADAVNETLKVPSFREWLHRTGVCGVFFSSCSGWLVRRETFSHVGGLDVSAWPADDWEFILRAAGTGLGVGVLTVPLVRYRPDGLSKSPAARVKYCYLNLQIIRRYDPAGEGWHSTLLTPEEYRCVLYSASYGFAWSAWELGEHALAREYLREARSLAPAGLASSLRHRLAAWQPGLYRALSGLSRR